MPILEAFEEQEEATQRQAIADVTAAGFVDCHAIFDALGFDRVNAGGMTRSVLEVADRWITDAGFTVVVIVQDGPNHMARAERVGCYAKDLPAIVAFKDAYYAELTVTAKSADSMPPLYAHILAALGRREGRADSRLGNSQYFVEQGSVAT